MGPSGGAEKPVFIRAVTKDEITNRCEICDALALWIAESRITGATAAYCQTDIQMFLNDPNYEVPAQLQTGAK
ncbi:MAG TPA: hypothetical protein VKT81_18770 [Bryobacteraceae bacterium]|nr:hypothetical protein [Bryobacteraceae bacterium]